MARAAKAPTGFARCVTGFLTTYMVGERGLSRRTVCSYARTVAAFVHHVEGATGVGAERIGFGEFTAEAVLGFLDSLEASGCGPSTRNQRLAALKSLAGYAMRECPEFMLEGQRICALRTKSLRPIRQETRRDSGCAGDGPHGPNHDHGRPSHAAATPAHARPTQSHDLRVSYGEQGPQTHLGRHPQHQRGCAFARTPGGTPSNHGCARCPRSRRCCRSCWPSHEIV